MDNQDLVVFQDLLTLITIVSRVYSDDHAKDWQKTLHRRLRDGNLSSIYEKIYQDIFGQTKQSLEELIHRHNLRDYDAGDYDDEPDETGDLDMQLKSLGIDTTLKIYGDIRDRKILACIASGMNKNVVRNLNKLDEAGVTGVLENICKQLQDRKNVGHSDILSEGSVDCTAWEARYREEVREAKDNHDDREAGDMPLVLRLKDGDAGMGRDVGSEHGSYV